jgi:hypothetical protein
MRIRTAWPWISLLLIAVGALNPVGVDFINNAFFSGEQLSRNIAGPIVLIVLAILCTLGLIEYAIRTALLRRARVAARSE